MKLDFNTENLDWDNVNILDSRYIWHLLKMVKERYFNLGIIVYEYSTKAQTRPRLSMFSPWGPASINELQEIYHAIIYLGNYIYLNEERLVPENFADGVLHKPLNFTLQDLCEIAEFDFFANPFMAGQPIIYYERFLLPFKKVLGRFKTILTNSFVYEYAETYDSLTGNGGPFVIRASMNCIKYDTYTHEGYTREVRNEKRLANLRDLNKWKNALNSYWDASLQGSYKAQRITNSTVTMGVQAQADYVVTNGSDDDGNYYNYQGWRYNEMNIRSKLNFMSVGRHIPGVNYSVYLHAYTNCRKWNSNSAWTNQYPNNNILFDYRFPLGMLKKMKEGIVPETGKIYVNLDIPVEDLLGRLNC
jgi:hypothetical protein